MKLQILEEFREGKFCEQGGVMKHTQRDIEKRVEGLLKQSHELAVATASDAILLFVVDGEVHCWASPALEGLVMDHASRQVLKSLLLEPISQKERQETIALYLSGKETYDEFPGVQVQEEHHAVAFIENVDERERRFKELFANIYTDAEAISELKSPLSDRTYDYMFVVAVPSGKIFSFASEELKPLAMTDHGRKLISTLLETNLKLMAEEADPDAKIREEAAIQRAKQKELDENKNE